MQFKTYRPDVFQSLIDCIWIFEHNGEKVDLIVPPSQYVNLTFTIDSCYYMAGQKISEPQIEGLDFQSRVYTHLDKTKIIGIRFMPYGLHSFFPGLLKNYDTKSIPLKKFIPTLVTNQLTLKLYLAKDNHEIIKILIDFLSKFYNHKKHERTKLVECGYQFFYKTVEPASVQDFLKASGSNYTTINRHFSKITGLSAKKMERLIKFRKTLCLVTNTNENLTNIAYQAGYYDQAHFIHEFSNFMNFNPRAYRKYIKSSNKNRLKINYNFSVL